MVTILSTFLGFVLGVQPVELSVVGEIASVELLLDEKAVATLRGEPWVVAVDFGSELAPRELLAIGRDREGHEVWRALRRINVPQARSQVEVILRDRDGPADGARAGLVWRSVDGESPDEWRVTLDGRPLEVADPGDFELPAHDPAVPHVLEAALLFGRSVARGELVFGGAQKDSVSSDLTALVFELKEDRAPAADEMAGWLSRQGVALEVVAVEQGGADIIAVHEATPRAWGSLTKLRRQILESTDRNPLKTRLSSGLNHEDRLRVVLPVGQGAPGQVTKFHLSPDFSTVEYGASSSGVALQTIAKARAYGFLASFPYPPEGPLRDDAPRQTADAVAVAAQVAAAANRARAVVLIREAGTADFSHHDPATVRRYLDRLQVPLFVWAVGRPGDDGRWGEQEGIASPEKFLRTTLALREALGRQVVVWVRGRHRANEVELSPAAEERLQVVGSGSGEGTPPPPESDFMPWIADRDPSAPIAEESAQQAAPTVAPTVVPIEPEPTATETFSEAVDVRLVTLDVVVSDAAGAPVYGLAKDDFEILEDSTPVAIRHIDAPAPPASPAPGSSAEGEGAPAVPPGFESERHAPSLVIFLQTGSLDAVARKNLSRALQETLAFGEPPGGGEAAYRTMLVTYDRGMEVETPLSVEPVALQQTLARIESGDHGRAPMRQERDDVVREIARIRAALNAAAVTGDGRAVARADRDVLVARIVAVSQELSGEVRQTLRALRRLTASLGAIDGRKILLYVGNGLELSPGAELFEEAERTLGLVGRDRSIFRVDSRAGDTRGDFDALVADANASGVTLYTLVPPNRRVADDVEGTSAAATGFAGRGGGSRQEASKSAACLLSESTGGLCQVGGTESALLLGRARRDLVATYTLAFEPGHPPDAAHHDLEVRLRGARAGGGLDLRHRPGYTDALPASRARDRLASVLVFGNEDNPLDVTLELGGAASTGVGELRLVPVKLLVPVSRLGVQPLAGGERFGVDARILLATRDGEGRTTEVQEYPVSFQIGRDKLEGSPDLMYSHDIHLSLPPGEHEVAVGLWDAIADVGSFITVHIGP